MIRQRVRQEILDAYLADNRKARILLKDESYIPAWQSPTGKRDRRPVVRRVFQRAGLPDEPRGRKLSVSPSPAEP